MAFDDSFVEQVRNSVSVVDFVSRYVPLKKSGREYGALCPFHSEKTPSFWVNEEKQIFKCFGCGVGGDVFAFVMQMESLSFPEAIRFVAESCAIPLPASGRVAQKEIDEKNRLFKLMKLAGRLFQEALKAEGGQQARQYLEARQIDSGTIQAFQMGYAPPGNVLLRRLLQEGYSRQDALACGLAKQNDRGEVYSNFRSRIMFPIRDLTGRVIAFGGRILGDGRPKYLNSPETKLYVKSRHLFGMDVARDEIRRLDQAILVEGYFDCVVPYQFGVKNVVASLGTSLTTGHVSLLARFSRNAIINYDPDLAGAKATMRSIDLLLEEGFQIRVMQLPGGQDPDTFVRENGVEAYRQKIEQAPQFFEYILEKQLQEVEDAFSPRGKREIVAQILPYLQKMADNVERAEWLNRVAVRLRVDEKLLWSELRKMPRRRGKPQASGAPDEERDPVEDSPIELWEKVLLAAVLEPELCRLVLESAEGELFAGLETESVFRTVFELRRQGLEPSVHKLRSESANQQVRDLVERMAFGEVGLQVDEDHVRGSIEKLRREQNRRRRIELKSRLAEPGLDFKEQMELMAQLEALSKKVHAPREPAAGTGKV